MKKTLTIIGIVLLSGAALCLLAALFFHHMHRSVLDGSATLYARLHRRFLISLRLGIGLGVSGTLALLAGILNKPRG